MLQLTCSAACGKFEICLIACPHNALLDPTIVPTCEPSVEKVVDENDEGFIVVEEQKQSE